MKYLLSFLPVLIAWKSFSQTDPEFPRGAVLYLSAQQGLNTSFDASADHYIGGMGISAQYTVLPRHLRLGAGGELVFTNKDFSVLAGPRMAWRISTFQMKSLGSLMNLQIQAEHLWGTDDQKLIGGILGLEIFQMLSVQLLAHRDYEHDAWWYRAGIGWNLLRKKRKSPTGTDPMRDL